jgi:hypothetical protein
MQEKKLISKLHSLRAIQPNAAWKKSNRDILFAQITGGVEPERANWFEVFENFLPERMVFVFSKPVAVFAAIALIVFGGSAVSISASARSKPGDSLYIAKIISEKTKLALTFDSKAKAHLNLEFAGNRATEATQVLSEAGTDQEKTAQLDELSTNFKKELTAVKSRLAKINPNSTIQNNDNGNTGDAGTAGDEKVQVFGSALEKTDKGLEVSETGENSNKTDSKNQAATTTEPGEAAVFSPADSALADAEKLFDQKDYQGSMDKLKEVSVLIDDGTPAVAPAPVATTSPATTTPAVKEGSATSTK